MPQLRYNALSRLLWGGIPHSQSAVKGAVRISPYDSVHALRYPIVSGLKLRTSPSPPQRDPVRLQYLTLSKQRQSVCFLSDDNAIRWTARQDVW